MGENKSQGGGKPQPAPPNSPPPRPSPPPNLRTHGNSGNKRKR